MVEGPRRVRPAPVFDVSRTEVEPLQQLDTGATGDGDALLSGLLDAAEPLDIDARIVPTEAWTDPGADGLCTAQPDVGQPRGEVKAQDSKAAMAGVRIHEHAHALLHVGVEDETERLKREVESEAVAYVVGRHFGLDTSHSAFTWRPGRTRTLILQKRFGRLSRTASSLIEAVERD